MKLIRLTLDDWRGIDHREIEFSDSVTLIEGPNEVGKSTIVEAVHVLFKELDSSAKQLIKAIQPVGRDVGSRVEAEVITGDFHFVYEKTYNKSKQTSLRILKPNPEQLTGREAHERAAQILDETIDMALWNALLVEQGKEIAGANLADSSGLARALDAAAGTTSDTVDDSALYGAVQAEYEQYFTLKTGKPRFSEQEDQLERFRAEMESARASLLEVEADSQALERATNECRRIERVLPELRSKVGEYEAVWKSIEGLNEKVEAKAAELDAANELHDAAQSALEQRRALVSKVDKQETTYNEQRELLLPQKENLAAVQSKLRGAEQRLKEAKEHQRQARAAAETANADEKHLSNLESLQALQKRLVQVAELNEALSAARQTLAEIRLKAGDLEEIRSSERALQVALARRDASASTIEVSAEQALRYEVDGETLELPEGGVDRRTTAAVLNLRLPGIAGIRVTPSNSAAELESELEACRATLDGLLIRCGVADLAEAITADAKRVAAEQEVHDASGKIEELLDGESLANRQAEAEDLQRTVDRYVAERPEEPVMPATLKQAVDASADAARHLRESEAALTEAQDSAEQLRDEYESLNADFRVAEQEIAGMEKNLSELRQQLGEARETEADKVLEERTNARLEQVATLDEDHEALQKQLEAASPEATEALLDNARNTLDRAEKDLQEELRRRAVLEDRLESAQADGRYEALEAAEQRVQAAEDNFRATVRRANAAKRLWETLNRHRDDARRVYVKPLKDGLENLGKIVFGPDFEVELDDGWQLVSRTLDGQTIPFDDLSVGTKEQLGILTRLAAARVVAEQGGVPLIIDDALGFSDPGRLESMGAAIASAGRECQVILLTCTPGRFMHVGNAKVVRL